jgi:outer membrane receptor for ferrienterochelin and colicins
MRSLFLHFLLLFPLLAQCQVVEGRATAMVQGHPVAVSYPGVRWLGQEQGVVGDGHGAFRLPEPPLWPGLLVVSATGYATDTVQLDAPRSGLHEVVLSPVVLLNEAQVIERRSSTFLDLRSTPSNETIGARELKRAACCDLSESFETSATVDVSYSDAISGGKTMRMLGLDGKYAQISVENVPFVRGLSTNTGLLLLPGTWINEINLSKGVGTAMNGPNAMTGQIELCLLDPQAQPPLFVNLYGNSQGRAEANVHLAKPTGAHSANLLLLHGSWNQRQMDQNNDGFLDMPTTRRVNVMDRWVYQNERKSGQLNLRVVHDERSGGQSEAHIGNDDMHAGHGLGPYTIAALDRVVDAFGKHGWIFKDHPGKSIGLIGAVRHHMLEQRYGLRSYKGQQQSAFASALYQQMLGKDKLKFGVALQFDAFQEQLSIDTVRAFDLGRVERMPGLFAEYVKESERLDLVFGMRVDWNDLYGAVASPRVHAKYQVGPLTVARAAVGHGFRTANPLVENASVLASSRRITVGALDMERAWNAGVSLLHKFKWMDRKWTVGADIYHTRFTAQVVSDLDLEPTLVVIQMLDGPSFSNSALADVQMELSRAVQLRASYRYYDVRTTYHGRLLQRPLTPANRGLFGIAYADVKERWRLDATLNFFGPARLPSTATNPEGLRAASASPTYGTVHAQVTHVRGAWEWYVGGENLGSFVQQEQIIAASDPYGPYFDASLIWGPTNPAMAYAGVRYTLPRRTPTTNTP